MPVGNFPQASMYSSLARDLTLSSDLSTEDPSTTLDAFLEERRRCYWCVVLLGNLYGGHGGTFAFLRDEKTPIAPQSPQPPTNLSSQMTDAALEPSESTNNASGPSDLGIVAYVIQLSEIWQRTNVYAQRRGRGGGLPPWSAQSDYSQITAELMDSETRLPYRYRFRPARFAEQDPLQLQENRDFWASWIFLRKLTLLPKAVSILTPLFLLLRHQRYKLTAIRRNSIPHRALPAQSPSPPVSPLEKLQSQ